MRTTNLIQVDALYLRSNAILSLTSKGAIVMLDVVEEVELVHDNGDDCHHSGVDSTHQPGGPTSLASTCHYVVGRRETEGLDLDKLSVRLRMKCCV